MTDIEVTVDVGVGDDRTAKAFARAGKLVYSFPAGATFRMLPQPNKYLCVCAHPDRPPWFVTHDGEEVDVESMWRLIQTRRWRSRG